MSAQDAPILLWFRRDLRLADHPALTAAAGSGAPVIPVFIWDDVMAEMGAAPRWRMVEAVKHFSHSLKGIGSELVLRQGPAKAVLEGLIRETGAAGVFWSRAYDPASISRDKSVKVALKAAGVEARSFPGHLLFEPWDVQTGGGSPYKVYSPMWRAVCGRDVGEALPMVHQLRRVTNCPKSENIDRIKWGAGLGRGRDIVAAHAVVGEGAARDRLDGFVEEKLASYGPARDFLARDATSGLSENLTYGEISPRLCWLAGMRAQEEGNPGGERFLQELVWREFSYHLLFHTPEITRENWRDGWDAFPWSQDASSERAQSWMRARTGVRLVDAGLREMFVTGRMHNRARMLVASYLTKHLMCHWKIGLDWFADCLTDWDPAANALGWQWVAGCGPDAAPYFRIFNPATQAEKFDADGAYRQRWLAERSGSKTATALSYFDAIPKRWGMNPDDPYPAPIVGLKEGREVALAAYANRSF